MVLTYSSAFLARTLLKDALLQLEVAAGKLDLAHLARANALQVRYEGIQVLYVLGACHQIRKARTRASTSSRN